MKRITVFVGHYGSGKTELAVNYAIKLSNMGKKVLIVDFDIVNPYFRTKDAEEDLKKYGVEVIAPPFANLNLENPALPAEINKAFDNKDYHIIFDVGGDDDGSIPLGRYHSKFMAEDIDVFFVLNERRIFTADMEGAIEVFDMIECVSRLKITGIINNTHLKEETTPEIVLTGDKFAREFAKHKNLPICYTGGCEEVLSQIEQSELAGEKFPIQNYIKIKF